MHMKRRDFYLLLQPLNEKFYRLAHTLIPDDLQAEQLVIDALNGYIIKEKKNILNREFESTQKREAQVLRRQVFKGVLKFICDIGFRRSTQLNEQMKLSKPRDFKTFYALEPKVRTVIALRYEHMFTVEEIEDIVAMPRFEVIEKIHNGRFLLMNELGKGMSL